MAAEGVAYAAVIDGCGVVIEVNSETDFAAKTDAFMDLVKKLAQIVAEQNPADVEALKACKYPGTDLTVTEVMQEKVMSIGENMLSGKSHFFFLLILYLYGRSAYSAAASAAASGAATSVSSP